MGPIKLYRKLFFFFFKYSKWNLNVKILQVLFSFADKTVYLTACCSDIFIESVCCVSLVTRSVLKIVPVQLRCKHTQLGWNYTTELGIIFQSSDSSWVIVSVLSYVLCFTCCLMVVLADSTRLTHQTAWSHIQTEDRKQIGVKGHMFHPFFNKVMWASRFLVFWVSAQWCLQQAWLLCGSNARL